MAQTRIENMVDPEIMTNMVSAGLPKAIAFSGIAGIDSTLEGQAGSTIVVPKFSYIGDAQTVAEGAAIDYNQLKTTTSKVTIKKSAVGVELTDESALSGYGDPIQETQKQIVMSVASKIDNDILDVAKEARLSLASANFTKLDFIDDIENAFADDPNGTEANSLVKGAIFLNPKDANKVRKAAANDWDRQSDLGDQLLITGSLGAVLGWQIVRTAKVPEGSAIVAKPDALRVFLKKNVTVESDRDITNGTTKFAARAFYGVGIYDDTKVLVINKWGATANQASGSSSTGK